MVNPISHSHELPSQASTTAVNVQNQLSEGIIPPIPKDKEFHELPQASATAVNVHDQLAEGIKPPVPNDNEIPELPPQASSTAVDVLNQLSEGVIPPKPPTSEEVTSSKRIASRRLKHVAEYI